MKKIITLLFSIFILNSFGASTFTITTTSIPVGYCQHNYAYSLLTNSGVGVTWVKSNGTLPSGIEVSPNGLISGSVGTFTGSVYSFTVVATDAYNHIATKALTLTTANLNISNTNYVKYFTNTILQPSTWANAYDAVYNNYDKPSIVGSGSTIVSKPSTWNGNAPTYTISSAPSISAISGGEGVEILGTQYSKTVTIAGTQTFYSSSISDSYNVTVTSTFITYSRLGNYIFMNGQIEFDSPANLNDGCYFNLNIPFNSSANTYASGGSTLQGDLGDLTALPFTIEQSDITHFRFYSHLTPSLISTIWSGNLKFNFVCLID